MGFRLVLTALFLCAPVAFPDIRGCLCDVAKPETATIKGCSLCLEAEKRPAGERVFLLRDNNPTKPNRWLALPRVSFDGENPLARMKPDERLAVWAAAVAKGRELWGEGWGVAMNGDISRTQCHLHVHIGKLLPDQERTPGYYIDNLAQLPAISDGTGLWFHPDGERFHVHAGQQTNETVLLR